MKKFFKPGGFWIHIWILSPFFRFFLRFTVRYKIFDVVVNNRERVPKKGRVIVASNHLSFADPVCLWGALRRNAVAMAAAEQWRNPLFGWVLILMRHIPVKRGDTKSQERAKAKFLEHLKAGGAGIIYPEAKISRIKHGCGANGVPLLLEFKTGVYYLSLKSDAPVVVVGVKGTQRLLPPGSLKPNRQEQVVLNFGEPIYARDFPTCKAFMTELRRTTQRLSGQEMVPEKEE